jgi:hypothetical protein
MRGYHDDPDIEADDHDFDYDEGGCVTCGGEGVVVVCIDDMCHGAGECLHGDGMAICPTCRGESAI